MDTEARRQQLQNTARAVEEQVRLAWQALITARVLVSSCSTPEPVETARVLPSGET